MLVRPFYSNGLVSRQDLKFPESRIFREIEAAVDGRLKEKGEAALIKSPRSP